MIQRICNLPISHSFFLFGARGTGKTTLLEDRYGLRPAAPEDTLFIDLLDPDQEDRFLRSPNELKELIQAQPSRYKRVIIDEVQKAPRLLDVVHWLIEKHRSIQFILTGSSARKLKHGGANLLGGRAFSLSLFPFTHLELPADRSLIEILSWGTLPKIFDYDSADDKRRYLRTYCQTYLKQEVQLEQLVRDIVSFREFLDLAAQSSGEIINYSNISEKSGVDSKTIARYFEILVDTMIGFFIEPFNESVRVRQSQKPKFYLFDPGVYRFLTQQSDVPLKEGSSDFGKLFEQWIVCECLRLNSYYERDFKFYYLRTKDGAEIDLIVQKPGRKRILIEIKSTASVTPEHLGHLSSLKKNIDHEAAWIICNETAHRRTDHGIDILPWRLALESLFRG
jgi:predicted AAA+ superfamily ATPase